MKLDNLSTRVTRRMRGEATRWRWQWLRYWRPNTQSGRLMAMVESVVLPVLVLWLGWKLRPGDPLSAHAGFPWAWFGPWLIAVRYGAGYGLFGVAFYAAFWKFAPLLFGTVPVESFPAEFFLGGMLMTLILGEFGAAFRNRQVLHREVTKDLTARLERTKRRLFVIKEALSTLEQELTDRPMTLRDALLDLRRTFTFQGNRPALPAPDALPGLPAPRPLPDPRAFLQLLSQSCRLVEAGIFVRDISPQGLQWRLAASLGQTLPALDPAEVLINRILETHQSVHIAQASLGGTDGHPWVFAAPLRLDEYDEVDAVLAVHTMPFMSFEENNLQRLQVLCASYLDFSQLELSVEDVRSAWVQAPISLQQEWAQLSELGQNFKLHSYCAVWSGQGRVSDDVLAEFAGLQPVESSTWTLKGRGGKPALVVLLPLLSSAGLANYRRDMVTLLGQILGRSNQRPDQAFDLDFLEVAGAAGFLELRRLLANATPDKSAAQRTAERP
ncbi:hypothetical protein [Thiomonas intermedia]|uniref:hypothetical protein n=1 Tax=Thiomonas intermedia TaxID=926 RepID=UPI0009A47B3B|nr:hypothetical protein [Thiomonas intermedia]